MSKRKHKRERANLFQAISQQTSTDNNAHGDAPSDAVLAASPTLAGLTAVSNELRMMKKFRFQLMHRWLVAHLSPRRVADVGGGKGLLAYLLQQSGWDATVIDPVAQALPPKYKDLTRNRRVKIAATETVPRRSQPFAPEMAADYDLLLAMHAHGCNVQIIDATAVNHSHAILLPCCIIDEPLLPAPGEHWIACLVNYALSQGLRVNPFRLNFRGQNIGLHIHHPAAPDT